MRRKQILIPNYLDKYIRELTEMHGMNWSESVRFMVLAFSCAIMNEVYLNRKCPFIGDFIKAAKKQKHFSREEMKDWMDEAEYRFQLTLGKCEKKRNRKLASRRK